MTWQPFWLKDGASQGVWVCPCVCVCTCGLWHCQKLNHQFPLTEGSGEENKQHTHIVRELSKPVIFHLPSSFTIPTFAPLRYTAYFKILSTCHNYCHWSRPINKTLTNCCTTLKFLTHVWFCWPSVYTNFFMWPISDSCIYTGTFFVYTLNNLHVKADVVIKTT